MLPKWLVIAVLVLMGFIVIGWALSHIVWVLLGAVLGYMIREGVEHAVNR